MAWANIKSRTANPNNKSYKRYHDLDRVMSPALSDNFEAFLKEIGLAPCDGRRWSVGRIDNNLGYVEGNIRWETDLQQARNKKMQDNNTTGFVGVSFNSGGRGKGRFVATWTDLNGSPHQKSFSILKYGYDEAKRLAVEYRAKIIMEMNECGAGYSEKHGHRLEKENSIEE